MTTTGSTFHPLVRLMAILAASLLLIDLAWSQEVASPAAQQVIPAGRRAGNVAIISIHGPVDGITARSIERRLIEAKQNGADAIVLEIDTPGGDMLATLDILYLLRSSAPANTVAWIRPKAFSAGTIIALAAREIVVDPNGVFGDAAPIQGMPVIGLRQMPPAERAKVEAPLLSEVVHEARRHGWDERLVQSFVAVDVALWLVENRTNGERLFLDADEFEEVFGEAPTDTSLKRLPPIPSRDPMTGLLPGARDVPDGPVPTKDERDAEIDSVQDLVSRRPDLSKINPEDWQVLGQVVSENELLVLRADAAQAYGLSSGVAASEEEIEAFFGANTLSRYDENWSEHLVRFLTWWPVRGVLITLMLIGFFIEMAAPGYGVFGAVATAALGVLLVAPLLTGLAEWWTALIVVLGLGLVAVELFVIPGVGFIGVIGGFMLFAGLVGTFLGPDPIGSSTRTEVLQAMATTAAGFFAAGVVIWLILRNLPQLPLTRRFVLADAVGGPGSDQAPPPVVPPNPTEGITVGDRGIAATDLRTAGRVDINGRLLDGRSVGGYINQGSAVRVTAIDQFGVEVEECPE